MFQKMETILHPNKIFSLRIEHFKQWQKSSQTDEPHLQDENFLLFATKTKPTTGFIGFTGNKIE